MTDTPGTEEPQLPPYVIEGARSSRSRCKTCRRPILKETLRVGILIEGPYGTGYLWHHLTCAARRRFHDVEEAYAAEAWNHAKKPPEGVPPLEKLARLQEEAAERKRSRKQVPHAEPAPSGRARCKHCDELIEKDSMRVVLGRGIEFGSQLRTAPINIHPRCVAEAIRDPECTTEIEGFAEALRTNSTGVPTERIEGVLSEIGSLS
jgi:hypothetical protein